MTRLSLAYSGLLCMCVLVAGCTSSRLIEAERPAQNPTIRVEPPDIRFENEVESVAPAGIQTNATTRVIVDTVTRAPTIGLEAFRLGRSQEEMWFRFRVGESTIEETWPLPAPGEEFWLTVDSLAAAGARPGGAADTVQATAEIEGHPRADTVMVRAPETEPSWWEKRMAEVRMLLIFALGVGLGLFIGRLFL